MSEVVLKMIDEDHPSFYVGYRNAERAAKASGTSILAIREATKAGLLHPHRVGLATVFLRAELEEWIRSRPAPHNRLKKETTNAKVSD